MKIGRNDIIAAIELRDMLRPVSECRFQVERFGRKRTKALLDAGLIERVPLEWPYKRTDALRYHLTTKGFALTLVRFVPRIDRAKADQIVEQFLQRVDQVNANPDYLMSVVEVRIFGSYITDAADFGDIDIARKLQGKWDNPEWTRRMREWQQRKGRDDGWEREVDLFIKARSPYISIHNVDELGRKGWQSVKVRPR
jgi:hypothetical protein